MDTLKIATHTLGCKLNYAETSHLVRQFLSHGYELVDFHDKADLYVVNTCTVTATAEKKCRTVIRQAVAQNPSAIVAVIGCFSQNSPESIACIPGVSLILGNAGKHLLYEQVQQLQKQRDGVSVRAMQRSMHPEHPSDLPWCQGADLLAYSSGDRTRTFFKVQDGCDYFCTYCAIPFARGRSRSASIADTLAMARQIAATGAKEVVLTGVNTGTFGQHQDEKFINLLRGLDKIPGIERYRISSIEPNLLTDEIIRFVAQSQKFAHHFHVPLQSGSDAVLKLMHRRYDTAFYADKIAYIKQEMPEACVACDLMVGFYGETPEEFERSRAFVEQLPLSYLHVFPYSERPNTFALTLPGKVPASERRRRCETMIEISNAKKERFYRENEGTSQTVLWESEMHGRGRTNIQMYGWTDNYIRVRAPYDANLVNVLSPVVLTRDNMELIEINA